MVLTNEKVFPWHWQGSLLGAVSQTLREGTRQQQGARTLPCPSWVCRCRLRNGAFSQHP